MFGSKLVVRRFDNYAAKYEARDVEEVKGRILFYGHSLFTRCAYENRWGNPSLEENVLGKDGKPCILNHGFGTSSADDLLYYYPRLVRPYEPRALVLCTSNNDYGFGYSPFEVVDLLARVVDWAKADFPEIPIYVFSHLPTLKAVDTVSVFTRNRDEFDKMAKLMCEEKGVRFVKLVDQPYLFENAEDVGDYNKIRTDLFCEDRTHYGPEGYMVFHNFIRELLDDIL